MVGLPKPNLAKKSHFYLQMYGDALIHPLVAMSSPFEINYTLFFLQRSNSIKDNYFDNKINLDYKFYNRIISNEYVWIR